MNGKFDAYVVWPLAKKFQNWIVDWSTARNYMVFNFAIMCYFHFSAPEQFDLSAVHWDNSKKITIEQAGK